jgi:selenocysteine lyase/cysteine desulfurase
VPTQLEATDLAEIRRREFPITNSWLYFDTATYGPHPRRYVQAISDIAGRLSTDPLGTTSASVEGVRSAAAQLLGAPEANVALLRSTGEGTNLVTGGLDWHAGDEVILYELDFPSLVAPWIALGERGVNVAVVADRGRHRFEVEDFERLLSPRTRAISVSLVNNTTGFRAPVEALAELCRARGLWFSVDAVQAIGSVVVDVPSLQADVVSAHGYKFQMSGFGYALVYLSDRRSTRSGCRTSASITSSRVMDEPCSSQDSSSTRMRDASSRASRICRPFWRWVRRSSFSWRLALHRSTPTTADSARPSSRAFSIKGMT